ncbi:hypothetical protein P8452_10661 [Trifolium repens]|nr:hypothetical protein QL285_084519 [Trifolium repens]WJX21199.1 hypothetical protein P8452_10661 [Trifolium repens]
MNVDTSKSYEFERVEDSLEEENEDYELERIEDSLEFEKIAKEEAEDCEMERVEGLLSSTLNVKLRSGISFGQDNGIFKSISMSGGS